MENQHRLISGYRELNASEIAQMNQLKGLGAALDEALQQVAADNAAVIKQATDVYDQLCHAAFTATPAGQSPALPKWDALDPDLRAAHAAANESNRCLALARTNLQQGLMWAIRGVAKPQGF